MNSDEQRLREVCRAARLLPDAAVRDRFLSEAVQGDLRMREEIEVILKQTEVRDEPHSLHPSVGEEEMTVKMEGSTPLRQALVIRPLAEEKPKTFPRLDRTGEESISLDKIIDSSDRIGPYRLLQEIGEGGFGIVWMAEQTEPMARRVALKVIKPGMDTREVIARFEAERQAIAMMDHPNIARVFDAGATASGRPYFAMELVKGLPINKFCDEQRLNTRRRLELFMDVCAAVNHAHQKGVIHRDLKPSNILVSLHGDKAVPKIIDFGIAKATQQRLTDKTLFTRFEQFIGTPVYMSPEQASLSGLDIDTRTDIYSLGILLYELLTGKPPFDAKTLLSAGIEEIRRVLREVDPPKPSTRLSTVVGDDRTSLARTHNVDPERLGKLIRGDLDWIVMKAIDKDRTRRYATADAFAKDVRRFLDNEPVEAAAPSAVYRLGKFVRRHRRLMATTAAAGFLLVAGTAVSLWQAARARTAEGLAASARQTAEWVLNETNVTLVSEFRSAGKLAPLTQVAETAVRYFEGLGPELRSPETERLYASALENLATVLLARKEASGASARWDEAIRLRRQLRTTRPGRATDRELTDALVARSEALRALEDFTAAMNAVTEAQQVLADGRPLESMESGELESLARAEHAAALIHAARSDVAQEIAALERFEATARQLASRPDATIRGRLLHPQALVEQGDVARDAQNPSEADRLYGEATTTLESLNSQFPDDAEVRRNLGIVYDRQGDRLAAAKAWPAAAERYEKFEATMRALTQHDPTNLDWQRELSVALNQSGDVSFKLKNFKQAGGAFDEAIAIRRRLAQVDPKNLDAQYELTSSLFRAAEVAFLTGDASGAESGFAEARAIAAAHAQSTDNPERWHKRQLGSLYRQILALTRRNGEGDRPAALRLAAEGRDLARTLETEASFRPEAHYSATGFENLVAQLTSAALPAATPPAPPAPAPTSAAPPASTSPSPTSPDQ